MNREQLEQFVNSKTVEFVKSLNGRYEEFVSDKFLEVYLSKNLIDKYLQTKHQTLSNMAYMASVSLFESILEYGCQARGNGHHVAQDYASFFPHKNVQEINEEAAA